MRQDHLQIRLFVLVALCLLLVVPIAAQSQQSMPAQRVERLEEWREATFGMFIHWGVYSGLGGEWQGNIVTGYAEHIMRSQRIPLAEYRRDVAAKFNPTQFDADEWVAIARAAGMKYLVITAKHHDGFAMWDSDVGDYDIVDATPFGRDPMRELRDACRREGLLFGFYYSHAQDWSHPWGQRNQWDFDHAQPNVRGWYRQPEWADYIEKSRIYVAEKSVPQMEELILDYDPDIMWFDTHAWLPAEITAGIVARARELKPSMVINSRGTPLEFDYRNTNDRPYYFHREPGYWEAIPTTNNSYGYHAHDKTHKPVAFFVELLARAAGRGGNLLMNVGPMGDGRIDPVDVGILRGIGDWLKVNGASIYDAERSPLAVQAWGDTSVKDNALFLHVFDWPGNGMLTIAGLASDVRKAYLLSDVTQQPMPFERLNERDLRITIPADAPDNIDTVIVVETRDGVRGYREDFLLSNHVASNDLHVFEGTLHGDKSAIAWGGGNIRSNFIETWTDPDAYVTWDLRVAEPGEFIVQMRFTATKAHLGNRYQVSLGHFRAGGMIRAEGKDQLVELGVVSLAPGIYELRVRSSGQADQGPGSSFLQLTEVRLIPAQ